MTWIGRKKLTLVPLYRPNAHSPDQIPADWPNLILQRMLLDPHPQTRRTDRFVRISMPLRREEPTSTPS